MKSKRGVSNIKKFWGNTLIFDLGGVVVFYDQKIAAKKLAPVLNVPEKKISKILSSNTNNFINAMEKGQSPRIYLKILAEELRIKKVPYKIFKEAWNSIFWPNKELLLLLVLLKRKYHLVLLSNLGKVHKDHLSRQYHLNYLFEKRFFSYKMRVRKPNEKIFNLTLRKLKLTPRQILFIDDKPENIEGAKKLGIQSILFKNNKDLIEQLAKKEVSFK